MFRNSYNGWFSQNMGKWTFLMFFQHYYLEKNFWWTSSGVITEYEPRIILQWLRRPSQGITMKRWNSMVVPIVMVSNSPLLWSKAYRGMILGANCPRKCFNLPSKITLISKKIEKHRKIMFNVLNNTSGSARDSKPPNVWLFTILIYGCKRIQALQFFKDNKIMACNTAVKILNPLENFVWTS